jgi:hypothetical protein
MPRSSLVCVALTAAALAGCCGPDPAAFPPVAAGDDAAVVAVVGSRASALSSLQAVVAMAFDGPEFSGTFDLVVSYTRAPRRIRHTAFKDLVVTDRDIFDLAFTPDGFRSAYRPRGAERTERKRGPLSGFPAALPELAGFYWAGEALFLPAAGEGLRVVERTAEAVLLESRLATGARVLWTLDPATLQVRRAAVLAPDGRRIALRYRDYRQAGSTAIPGAVRFHDPQAGTTITVQLKQLDVDPPLGPADFRPGDE